MGDYLFDQLINVPWLLKHDGTCQLIIIQPDHLILFCHSKCATEIRLPDIYGGVLYATLALCYDTGWVCTQCVSYLPEYQGCFHYMGKLPLHLKIRISFGIKYKADILGVSELFF